MHVRHPQIAQPATTTYRTTEPARETGPETERATGKQETPQTPRLSSVHLGSVASDRELLLRGRRAFERGEDRAALENLTRLTRHGVAYADVHYMIGMLHERAGDLDGALESLRKAIRINPSYVEALLALASLHERRGDFDQSQGYAERAAELSRSTAGGLDPTTRGKLANQQAALGDALAEAGERRDAIEEYRRALDRCPTFHDIRHRLGMTLREAGLPSQAAQEFQRILRLHPQMLDSQIQLGLTYYSMGRTPDAIAEWDAVLEKDPSRDEARMYLRLVRGADRRIEAAATRASVRLGTETHSRADEPAERGALDVAGWSTTPLRPSTETSTDSPAPSPAPPSHPASKSDAPDPSAPDLQWLPGEGGR